ncbi:MAG: PAS domain S-box protein [Spirochaetota bacterium]
MPSASRQTWQSIIDRIPLPTLLLDAERSVVAVNPPLEELTGLKAQECLGKKCWTIFHDPDIGCPPEACPFSAMVKTGKPSTGEMPLEISRTQCIATAAPLFDEAGELEFVVYTLTDITALKRHEAAVQESESSLRAIFESSLEAFVAIDSEGLIQTFNQLASEGARTIWGKELRRGESIHRIISPKNRDTFDWNFRRAMNGQRVRAEKAFRLESGERWMEFTYSPVIPTGKKASGVFIGVTDITGRKRTEEVLKRSEERLKLVLQGSNDGHWDWNLESDRLFYSDRWWQMLGYRVGELPSDSALWERLLHPDDRKETDLVLQAALADGSEGYEHEFRLRHKDGHYVPILTRGHISRDSTGRAIRISGTNTDLSELHRDKEKLRQSEKALTLQNRLFYSLLENLPMGVFMIDAVSGKTLLANDAALRILGRGVLPAANKENLIDLDKARKAGHEGPYPPEVSPILRGMRGETSHVDDLIVERPDGSEALLEIFGAPVRDEQGLVLASLVSFSEITERKRAETKVQESAASMARAEKVAKLGNWKLFLASMRMEISAGMCALFGVEEGSTTVAGIRQVGFPEYVEMLDKALADTISRDVPYDVEFRIRRPKDGMVVDIRSIADFDKVNNVLFGVVQDITESKKSNDRIRSLLAEKELLLKEVHHRVKNNMNTVWSLLSLQATTVREVSASNALEGAASRVQSMMLLYDRLFHSEGYVEISLAAFLPFLVDEILANFPNRDSITVIKNIEDFILDAKRLQAISLIVNELLTNAMKYAFAGRANGELTIGASLQGGTIIITVADNGNGMPKESGDKDNHGFGFGFGFGLSLAHILAEQLGGSLRIEQERGTKVLLQFEK